VAILTIEEIIMVFRMYYNLQKKKKKKKKKKKGTLWFSAHRYLTFIKPKLTKKIFDILGNSQNSAAILK
jgi:hypothetical protein